MKPTKIQAAMSAFHWRNHPTTAVDKSDLHRVSLKPLKNVRVVVRCDAVSTTQCGVYSKAAPARGAA